MFEKVPLSICIPISPLFYTVEYERSKDGYANIPNPPLCVMYELLTDRLPLLILIPLPPFAIIDEPSKVTSASSIIFNPSTDEYEIWELVKLISDED